MGSGHFLVNLVNHLADQAIAAMAEAEAVWDGDISPVTERIDGIRNTIMANAEDGDWALDPEQLDGRHISDAWCSNAASMAWARIRWR